MCSAYVWIVFGQAKLGHPFSLTSRCEQNPSHFSLKAP